MEDIVSSLREMGIPEEDARRLIVLANREILLTLRHDLREIVRSVVEEERERIAGEMRDEMRKYIDAQLRVMNRNLLKMIREELGKYISELSKLEEKAEIMERRLLDLEKAVYHRPRERIRIGGVLKLGHILIILSLVLGAVSYFLVTDTLARIALALVAFVLFVGGVLLA